MSVRKNNPPEIANRVYRIAKPGINAACESCRTNGIETAATWLVATPYDLAPGGEVAHPACDVHAWPYTEWSRRNEQS